MRREYVRYVNDDRWPRVTDAAREGAWLRKLSVTDGLAADNSPRTEDAYVQWMSKPAVPIAKAAAAISAALVPVAEQ